VANYQDFFSTQPPLFSKVEEPLDADAWLCTIESKFSLLTIPCADSSKAHFTAQQLRGAARIWWDNYCAMQADGHVISWEEFQNAFRAHHIPKGLMERKLNEFLALTQGTRTVLQYAQAFNHLCQYAGYHADSDTKKQDRFRRGLSTKLKERLNLVSWLIWPSLRRIASRHTVPKRNAGFLLDPQAFNPRGNDLFRMHRLERHGGMLRSVDWFSGCLNKREGIDHPYPRNNHNNLAHGQMFNKSNKEAAFIAVSIAGVRFILSEIVHGPRNLTKGRVPIRVTRTRARGR
jgi:hypothetical protein